MAIQTSFVVILLSLWWQEASIIYVDQPVGTGFSYTSSTRDIHHEEEVVSEDIFDFFQVDF